MNTTGSRQEIFCLFVYRKYPDIDYNLILMYEGISVTLVKKKCCSKLLTTHFTIMTETLFLR